MRRLLRRESPFESLEQAIGYRFRDTDLLALALTHPSYRSEQVAVTSDNQRLEFLGDAVLGQLSAERLFAEFPSSPEGDLTAMRSHLTNGQTLAAIAHDIGIGDFLNVGKGEENSGGRRRRSNLADALEAIIGAAWIDGGRRAVDRVFAHVFGTRLASLVGDTRHTNPKGMLQEFCQRRWNEPPRYRVLSEDGPPHARHYTVDVALPDGATAQGAGSSKRAAESAAARNLLDALPEAQVDSPTEPGAGGAEPFRL